MSYLYIFEDGSIKKSDDLDDEDKQGADDRYLDLIDISDPLKPIQYYDGEWHKIEKILR